MDRVLVVDCDDELQILIEKLQYIERPNRVPKAFVPVERPDAEQYSAIAGRHGVISICRGLRPIGIGCQWYFRQSSWSNSGAPIAFRFHAPVRDDASDAPEQMPADPTWIAKRRQNVTDNEVSSPRAAG